MLMKPFSLLRYSILPFTLLLLNACAPQQPAPEVESTPDSVAIQPLQMVTATPRPQPTVTQVPRQASRPAFDPENPDWELRYHELYERNAHLFRPPSIGQNVSIDLANGRTQRGILNQLSPTEISLDAGNGVITYPIEGLSEESAANFFQAAFARNRALAQGRIEYQRWLRMQEAAKPTPTPIPPRTVREIASTAVSENEKSETVPEYQSRISGIPKNEGPTGRVAQVDEYIRKHAAVPHSLRVKAWGPVQPHNNGYKVRVQYTLESADGFGLSNEDMMFFMNANGRVYQKAPVK